MRLIDADKLYPDRLTKTGELAISQSQIADAPTVDTYTEDDVQYAIKEGHQVGYEMAKAKFERPTGKWIPVEPDCRGYTDEFKCSNCNNHVKYSYCMKESEYPICPNCGANMIKEAENE